ncbi:MAG: hypothetical protein ACFCGT_06655 [Sandaracinaceae bacterium]
MWRAQTLDDRDVDPDDVDEVRRAFLAAERHPPRAWTLRADAMRMTVAVAVAGALIVAGLAYLFRPLAPLRDELEVNDDAWTEGGRPDPGTPAQRRVFEELLPAFIVRGALGFTRPQVRDALVLLSRVEGHLTDRLLPALGPAAPMPLVDDEARTLGPWADEAEARAGDEVQHRLDYASGTLEALPAPLEVGRRIDREALAVLFTTLLGQPGPELSTAASALWVELFDRPLPPLEADG